MTPTRHGSPNWSGPGSRSRRARCRIRNSSGQVVAGRDTIIHLAAAQHESGVPDSYFETVNVAGTRNLLAASRDAGVRRFVYGSTIGVYGSAASGTLDESSPPNPDNVYGRTKLAAERVVREQGTDFETCIVRISETYGPGDFRLLKLFRAIDRGKFLMIGSGENRRQAMHVDDLVRALLIAAVHPMRRRARLSSCRARKC